jgi:hypothetical protein
MARTLLLEAGRAMTVLGMPPDSLTLAAAIALFAACVGAWRLSAPLRAAARLQLRFAAMLLAALAVARVLHLADMAALLLLPLAGTALALATLARCARPAAPFAATAALVAALACGLVAMLSGHAMPALIALMLAGLAVIAAALNGAAPVAILSGVALLASGLCALQMGVGAGSLLFSAAALVGLSRPRAQLLRSTIKAWRGAHLP